MNTLLNYIPRKQSAPKQAPQKQSRLPLEDYFTGAETWDQEIFANISLSRDRAWMIAYAALGLAALSGLSLVLLLPLKTFAPYVVTVDKSSGYVEVTKGLYDGKITVDDAVTEANLYRYVTTRESYNPAVLRENYAQVALMSTGTALAEYQHVWDGANPDNPSVRFGRKAAVTIEIKSVSFLGESTASVRFRRALHADNQIKYSDWNAVITFQYVNAPMRMEDRFLNPLGFQVTSYRLNPEAPESAPSPSTENSK